MRTPLLPIRLLRIAIAAVVTIALGLGVVGSPLLTVAGAKPPPWSGGEVEGYDPYKPAHPTLDYALAPRAGGWVAAWKPWDDTTKPWTHNTYNPAYVHPKSFKAIFANQCVNETDWDLSVNKGEPTENIYRWRIDNVTVLNAHHCSRTELQLVGQTIHQVQLDIVSPSGTVLLTKTGLARAKDHLVVLLGDSAASGEGSPEGARIQNDSAVWGTWVDRRCHRSTHAAVPRAVAEFESADPHSTVTFLNFACSGATLERTSAKGSGILGPYWGIEGPKGLETEEDPKVIGAQKHQWLPSQVDQLTSALGTTSLNNVGLPARTVDKLFMSGGINDVRFASLALACVVKSDCPNETGLYSSDPLKLTFDSHASQIPTSYGKVKNALAANKINVTNGYVMEYPNPLTNTNGKLCTSILDDVLPTSSIYWLFFLLNSPLTVGFAPLINGFLLSPLMSDYWSILANGLTGQLHWDAAEIKWLSDVGVPRLTKAVKDGAALAGFTYVGGIADLFIGHGYCAKDNWLVRAPDSSYTQGPWDFVSRPIGLIPFGLGIHAKTQGLIHPTRDGYKAMATKVLPPLMELANKAPVAKPDDYTTDIGVTLDTGFGAGVLLNDHDPDGDELSASLVSQPLKGTATLSSTGRLVYVPNPGAWGKDVLTYRVSDGARWSAPAQITIMIIDPAFEDWVWTFPVDQDIPEVAPGTTVNFPLCERCVPATGRIPIIVRRPGYGTVELSPDGDGYRMRYNANPIFPADGTVLDTFEVELWSYLDGRLGEVLDRVEIGVYVEPPQAG